MARGRLLFTVVLVGSISASALALGVPKLSGRVNDYADLISPAAEARIAESLAKLEQDTGAQVVVLTIDSLDGESLEEFSLRVAETWKLGRAEQDDGALLLIAKEDRAMRIEVGYGLEAVLSDVMSKRILDQVLRPRFRAGDFDGGVERAAEAIDGLIRGTSTLPPPDTNETGVELPPRAIGVLWLLFLVPFVLVVIGSNPFQWFLYLFLIPFVFVGGVTAIGLRASPVLLALWLIGAPIIWSFVGRRRKKHKPRGAGRRAGWTGSSWSSGGGGFSSGGGFSGGGGSFGGGGSSSRW